MNAVATHIPPVLRPVGLEHIHGCCIYNFLWQVVPVVDDSAGEECLPCCNSVPWLGELQSGEPVNFGQRKVGLGKVGRIGFVQRR